jgi:hypothetical protein
MPDFDKLAHRLLYELTGEQAYTKGEHDTLRVALIAVYNEGRNDGLEEAIKVTGMGGLGRIAVRAKKVAPLSAPDALTSSARR